MQLIESPIFTHVRLQLLEPEQHPYLLKALWGILMLLPQSPAFHTLKNRLASVPEIGHVTPTRTLALALAPSPNPHPNPIPAPNQASLEQLKSLTLTLALTLTLSLSLSLTPTSGAHGESGPAHTRRPVVHAARRLAGVPPPPPWAHALSARSAHDHRRRRRCRFSPAQ